MREFDPPITITKRDGSTIEVSSVRLVLVDNASKRMAHVHPLPSDAVVVLWRDADYDAAGDYTQQDIEDRFDLLVPTAQIAAIAMSTQVHPFPIVPPEPTPEPPV